MKIVIAGGGLVGLSSALLLARDGHEVTVVERDAAAPTDPSAAWEEWERRGVNQFRLPHLFASRFRTVLQAELPDVMAALVEAGALSWHPLDHVPASLGQPGRPGDGDPWR